VERSYTLSRALIKQFYWSRVILYNKRLQCKCIAVLLQLRGEIFQSVIVCNQNIVSRKLM